LWKGSDSITRQSLEQVGAFNKRKIFQALIQLTIKAVAKNAAPYKNQE
jgi:hypothetical protein